MRHNKGLSPRDLANLYNKSERTIYRWLQSARGGQPPSCPEAVIRRPRAPKFPSEILAHVLALKRQLLRRSATSIQRALEPLFPGQVPSVATIRRHLVANGLSVKDPAQRHGYVKFQRKHPNDLWQIDIAGVRVVGYVGKVFLFALLDDCSRFVVAARYFRSQSGTNVIRLLRAAFEEYGRPNQVLADNGAQFKNVLGDLGTRYAKLLRSLEVQPIFSRPRHPQTKGKLERWFGTVAKSFLIEARFAARQDPDFTLADLNLHLQEWVTWYNTRKPHRSLPGQCPPAQVYLAGEDRIYRPLQAKVDWDRWISTDAVRKVTKYNFVSYKGATYAVPPGFAGCKVDLRDRDKVLEIDYRSQLLATFERTQDAVPDLTRVTRRVTKVGTIRYKGGCYTVGYKLAGRVVEVQETPDKTHILVYLDNVLVKELEKQ